MLWVLKRALDSRLDLFRSSARRGVLFHGVRQKKVQTSEPS